MTAFGRSPLGIIAALLFAALLLAVCLSDLRTRRIPNRLVVGVFVCGAVYSLLAEPGVSGVLRIVGGVAVGLTIWGPFFALRMLGAGDVKFFAAASAWLGAGLSAQAAFWAALAGGVLALVWLVRGRASRGTLPVASRKLPYGVAMVAGIAAAVLLPAVGK